jgi:hypothetical protein
MNSRIEFARIVSRLDVNEFFLKAKKIESDALTKDSYERNAKLKFE